MTGRTSNTVLDVAVWNALHMPEGPEIRLAADKVARVLVDHEIVEVEFHLGRCVASKSASKAQP